VTQDLGPMNDVPLKKLSGPSSASSWHLLEAILKAHSSRDNKVDRLQEVDPVFIQLELAIH